jgi:hypothetical protein
MASSQVRGRALILLSLACACDPDALQPRLQAIITSQGERADRFNQREVEKSRGGRNALAPPIARALDIVAASDFFFLVHRGPNKPPRRYSGHDFANMLTTKTLWLGRDIDDLDQWIREIATGSFFGDDRYLVRRPDGVEEPFPPWIERQLIARPILEAR